MNKTTEVFQKSISLIKDVSPEIAQSLKNELYDQRSRLKLIASENYSSDAVRACEGSIITDKYAEGYVDLDTGIGHRYYSGCNNVDNIEYLGSKWACELFGAEYAYLQPHSGSNANLIAYWSILMAKVIEPYIKRLNGINFGTFEKEKPTKTIKNLTREEWDVVRRYCTEQKLLAMSLDAGGHLTHGDRTNISSQMFDCYFYGLDESGYIDYNNVREMALKVKPLILLAGFSAYPRDINFKIFRDIADEVGAVLMVDFSHPMGLLAGGLFKGEYNPVPYADIITSTSHKTLRGPRSAFILSKAWLKPYLEKGCPLVQGGELPNMVAAKAICFKEAMSPEFKQYAKQTVKNAQALAEELIKNDIKVVTGGTDNHIVLIDVSPLGLTGRQAEIALEKCNIITNRNSLYKDPNGAWYTSGIRLGTAALTTCGMTEKEMKFIGKYIANILHSCIPEGKAKVTVDSNLVEVVQDVVKDLLFMFPPYKEINKYV